jgi:hypothetical protein
VLCAISLNCIVSKEKNGSEENCRRGLTTSVLQLSNKAKVEPKTVQGILRHSRIQTTLDLYTQDDSDRLLAANPLKEMVGTRRLELLTSTVSR